MRRAVTAQRLPLSPRPRLRVPRGRAARVHAAEKRSVSASGGSVFRPEPTVTRDERGTEPKSSQVATTEIRTARFPGTRKDDNGGRFPGSSARAASQAFPRTYLSG